MRRRLEWRYRRLLVGLSLAVQRIPLRQEHWEVFQRGLSDALESLERAERRVSVLDADKPKRGSAAYVSLKEAKSRARAVSNRKTAPIWPP
jgi:hypothetical protein